MPSDDDHEPGLAFVGESLDRGGSLAIGHNDARLWSRIQPHRVRQPLRLADHRPGPAIVVVPTGTERPQHDDLVDPVGKPPQQRIGRGNRLGWLKHADQNHEIDAVTFTSRHLDAP